MNFSTVVVTTGIEPRQNLPAMQSTSFECRTSQYPGRRVWRRWPPGHWPKVLMQQTQLQSMPISLYRRRSAAIVESNKEHPLILIRSIAQTARSFLTQAKKKKSSPALIRAMIKLKAPPASISNRSLLPEQSFGSRLLDPVCRFTIQIGKHQNSSSTRTLSMNYQQSSTGSSPETPRTPW